MTTDAAPRPTTLLLNATTINKGGGVQAAVAFILQAIAAGPGERDSRWIFAVSGEVRDQLAGFGHALRDGIDLCLERSPARSLRSRARLREFAARHADLVFTFFGPAYVKFDCPHLCGVADPWVTHPTRLAYSRLPTWLGKVRVALLCVYKGLWFRRADCWVVEHEAARQGLIGRVRLPRDDIFVVNNNCGPAYFGETHLPQLRSLHSPIRILTFAADYPHKCLDMIPQVAVELLQRYDIHDVRFIVTIPAGEFPASAVANRARSLGVGKYIENTGFVPLREGPGLYRSCDILLMPTVLETFSATYPESMCMGIPIVTSDLDFARSVCGDAAVYFEPLNAVECARSLATVIRDPGLRAGLIAAGYRRLADFPSPAEKYRQLRAIVDRCLAAAHSHSS